jgi:hypothetical protein
MTDAAADASSAAGARQDFGGNRVVLLHARCCTRPAMPAIVWRCTSR